ncbi:MAG: hypothetical protein VX600_03210 [Candidatus Neomarinimicrobiota bacterium]|jgi:hypothetical protein|nr:hypothetical protein [Candidatus Neomarinimicrobiota bacterium]|tara:strand:- start:42 stop:365 length:324 start_codon:yes stop_codon:yes gene_type:complete
MKSDKIDKIISILFLVLSAGVIIWWFMIAFSNAETEQNVFTLFTLDNIVKWGQANMDIVIISYIFFCLQAAGISELKQQQDYLLVAIISLIFTPLGLLFIKNDENEK